MPAIFFAIISYLCSGVGNIFGTIATRKIGGYSTAFWYIVIQITIFSFFAIFFLDDVKNFSLNILVLNFLLGLIGTVGLIAFYEGLRIANASLVGTISASYAAIAVVLSIILFGERVNFFQSLSIITIFLGVVISSIDLKKLSNEKSLISKGILLAIITAILWGIYWTFIRIPIEEIGWYWAAMVPLSTFPLILFFMKIRKENLLNIKTKGALFPLIANAVLIGIGSFSFNYAISRGLTIIVVPIAGSSPTLFVLLAFLILKDTITRQQIIGIVITLIGIVSLSVFSI